MRRIHWTSPVTDAAVLQFLPRSRQDSESVRESVLKIISEVKESGAEALRIHALKFDGVDLVDIRVPREQLKSALDSIPSDLRHALEESARRVRVASESHLPENKKTQIVPGGEVEIRFQPFESVGVYAPGGKAVYPSSVIMNVVPALVAGVKRVVLCSPAQKENGGLPHPSILAAAELLGVTEVYSIGGASAIASLAYGVEDIGLQPVDLVTGPGNIFVATAKQILRNKIAIDSEAGPTEILIIADDTANPGWVAADLISQAEHDENAAAVLLSDSAELIENVQNEINSQLEKTANRNRVEAALSGLQSALVLVDSISTAVEIANLYATEHLEILTANPRKVLSDIRNAGAVFLGQYSPVSLGDYLAGSNHVLPTSGNARRSAGLSVFTFLRPQQIVDFTEPGLRASVEQVVNLSNAEGLPAHGEAARIRFNS